MKYLTRHLPPPEPTPEGPPGGGSVGSVGGIPQVNAEIRPPLKGSKEGEYASTLSINHSLLPIERDGKPKGTPLISEDSSPGEPTKPPKPRRWLDRQWQSPPNNDRNLPGTPYETPETPLALSWPPRRAELATWPDAWREKWGRLANHYEDEGCDWKTAEFRAFTEVLDARLALGLPEFGTPGECSAPDTDPSAPRRPDDQPRLDLNAAP